jgi:hypothetical protein
MWPETYPDNNNNNNNDFVSLRLLRPETTHIHIWLIMRHTTVDSVCGLITTIKKALHIGNHCHFFNLTNHCQMTLNIPLEHVNVAMEI